MVTRADSLVRWPMTLYVNATACYTLINKARNVDFGYNVDKVFLYVLN